MKVVWRATPFQLTTEPEKKLVPFTVKVKAGPPSRIELGVSDVMVGVFGGGGGC